MAHGAAYWVMRVVGYVWMQGVIFGRPRMSRRTAVGTLVAIVALIALLFWLGVDMN